MAYTYNGIASQMKVTPPGAITCIACLSIYWPFCLLAANQCDTAAICMKTLGADKFYTVIASTEV